MLTVTIAVVAAVLASVAVRRRDSGDPELPITPIADVVDGCEVAIVGRLELAGAPLHAPVSGRACAAYSATIEYHDRRCRRRVVHEQSAREFIVRDASGAKAVVRAPRQLRGGQLAVLRPMLAASRPSRRVRRFLRRHGLAALPSLDGMPFADRCDESTLQPDQRVAIVGVAHWEPDPSPDRRCRASGYRDVPTRVVFASATVIA